MADRVRSLKRGLDILTALNAYNGATLPFLAKSTGLNRGTVYRMLLTLQDEGFVRRDTEERYWLCGKVQALADGYHDEQWIDDIVRPAIKEVGQSLLWPVSLVTPSGLSMLVRITTDHDSPLAVHHVPTGWRNPIAGSASGQVYLAYCDDAQRETVLDLLCTSSKDPRDQVAQNRAQFDVIMKMVRHKGFAYANLQGREFAYALPVLTQNRYLASLVIRVLENALRPAEVIEKIIPKLKKTALQIGEEFSAMVS